jgi:hypothetical protein
MPQQRCPVFLALRTPYWFGIEPTPMTPHKPRQARTNGGKIARRTVGLPSVAHGKAVMDPRPRHDRSSGASLGEPHIQIRFIR